MPLTQQSALRVSRRELEYAFRTVLDLSPHEFFHNLRLNAVRRALLRRDPGDTILRILLDHGLTHPGRFATDYRTMFGEQPSETLRGKRHERAQRQLERNRDCLSARGA